MDYMEASPRSHCDVWPGDMVKLIRSTETDTLVIYHYMRVGVLWAGKTVV